MRDVTDWPVMKRRCSTCPFGAKGELDRNPDLADMIRARSLQVSQVCHHPRLNDKPETHLCRGARDFQLPMLHRLGVIDAPTDEAFARQQKLREKK